MQNFGCTDRRVLERLNLVESTSKRHLTFISIFIFHFFFRRVIFLVSDETLDIIRIGVSEFILGGGYFK